MSVATASSARVIGSVAKVAKTTGSVSLFCLRLPLYVLSFILLAIVAISVYYLASLYFAYQDFSSNSQQSTDFLPLFSQGWLAEREAEAPNDHSARPSTKSVFTMPPMDASNSTEPSLKEGGDSQAIIVDEPVSTSVFVPHDPEIMTRNRFANFGLRPEVMLAENNTAPAQSTVPVQSTATAQNTAPAPDTVAALLAATADAITDTAVATDTTATTAHSHFPFTAVNSFNWLTASDSAEAPHRLSVTERMEANNQAVDSRLDDILAQRELECLAQTQAQAQAMVQALTAAAFDTVDKVNTVDGTNTTQAITANAATTKVASAAITTETAPAKDAAVTTTAATAITTEPQAQATLSTACVSMTKHSDCISS